MGISETHWTGQGKVVLEGGDTIIYSGREDDNHGGGVGILMTRFAARSLIDWTPISERIITARFYSKHVKMTIVHVPRYIHQQRMQKSLQRMNSMRDYRMC